MQHTLAASLLFLLGAISSPVARAAGDDGMQRMLERGGSLRNMIVCGNLKRGNEAGPRDNKDLQAVQDGVRANAPACLLLLGRWLERGEGMPKDVEQARTLYTRAAALDADGHVALGRMAEQGIGGPVSYPQAWDHYSQAAATNNRAALVSLGHMAEQGLGRAPSDRDALEYYRRAARRWSDDAWSALDRIQSARAVMTADEVAEERRRWRGLLAVRVEDVIEAARTMSSFTDFPYEVTLHFAFKRGERAPATVSIVRPSKDPALDAALQQALATVQMPAAPIFGPDSPFELDLPMRLHAEPTPSQKAR